MNSIEHLKENVETFSPLENCTEAENALLAEIADKMAGYPTIPCTTCAYCMPCPYGVDIPGNFAYYNEAVNSHLLPLPEKHAADYAAKKQQFADGLRKALPNVEAWARSCTDCEECLSKCPQQIRIPNQMARIVELLRKNR
jgi:predicted aldo/keto reductase-like oxidoreductase